MATIILFNKPFGVLSQFRDKDGRPVLGDYIDIPDVYPAGRLDADSEGLMLLTSDGKLQHQIANPKFKLEKTYWAQVEGEINEDAMQALRNGVELKDGRTRPAKVRAIEEPDLWPREPPVRYRAAIPTSWVELKISEGKNRQVRRMTANVGFPTLRLVRVAIGPYALNGLTLGQWREVKVLKF